MRGAGLDVGCQASGGYDFLTQSYIVNRETQNGKKNMKTKLSWSERKLVSAENLLCRVAGCHFDCIIFSSRHIVQATGDFSLRVLENYIQRRFLCTCGR